MRGVPVVPAESAVRKRVHEFMCERRSCEGLTLRILWQPPALVVLYLMALPSLFVQGGPPMLTDD